MLMERKYNFNAGPAHLPLSVLKELSEAVVDYDNTGLSIAELPHRGKHFATILDECTSLFRSLCKLDNDYEILWLQGGGRMQFAMIPMNFLSTEQEACYIESGHWAKEAAAYASYYGSVKTVSSSESLGYNRLPDWPQVLPPNAAYLHLTTNNTIFGTQWHHVPHSSVPLVADMSSDILGVERDYNQFDLLYSVAQKNLGTAGIAVVAIRRSFLDKAKKDLPPFLSYTSQVASKSLVNTANVIGVYTTLLMLRWTEKKGIDNIIQQNIEKARLLYHYLDSSEMFSPSIKNVADRSLMNVCFTCSNKHLETEVLEWCASCNILGIEGHRNIGGFRVSLYNSISIEDVSYLLNTLTAFELKHR